MPFDFAQGERILQTDLLLISVQSFDTTDPNPDTRKIPLPTALFLLARRNLVSELSFPEPVGFRLIPVLFAQASSFSIEPPFFGALHRVLGSCAQCRAQRGNFPKFSPAGVAVLPSDPKPKGRAHVPWSFWLWIAWKNSYTCG